MFGAKTPGGEPDPRDDPGEASEPLHDVLQRYQTAPEDLVPSRYVSQFVKAKKVAFDRGEISKGRFRALRDLPRRGYLDWWNECPISQITGPPCTRGTSGCAMSTGT
jgi:hypothetical protein